MRNVLVYQRKLFHFLGVCLFLIVFVSSSGFAQIPSKPDLWKADFLERISAQSQQKISTGNLHIVAVMVEFQPDSNRFTSGIGTFNPDYLNDEKIVIDPLPHNQQYFEDHLSFTEHYFRQASHNQLTITFQVLPNVYRLDAPMSYYSPTGAGNENDYKLGWLIRDTWQKVDSGPAIDISNWDSNTLFIIFHAGAGRDFDFLGTTLERTPQDIPSLYLSKTAISKLLDDSSFNGFQVKNKRVTNTGILPETESRKGSFLGESYILQLGINGLTTAIVGNHLGLPDLYNTVEGSSGIGRFGLMDPEGFFAYFGLFPPLPSAWERIYMGWDGTFTISESAQNYLLPLPSNGVFNKIAKYPISTKEYYLFESRVREDISGGVTLKIRNAEGNIENHTFTNQDTRFSAIDLDSLTSIFPKGNLLEVSNYDWALPGGLDAGNDGKFHTSDDRILNGGILIWHIDETIIEKGFETNSINANIYRRGVELIEADGAQDIGNPANDFLSMNAGGTAFDFWWSGNDYTVITEFGDSLRVYKNRFAPDTQPATKSSSGSVIPIEFYDFNGTHPMSFSVRPFQYGLQSDVRFSGRTLSTDITQTATNPAYPFYPFFYHSGSDTLLIIPSKQGLFALHSNKNHAFASVKIADSVFRQPLVSQNKLLVATQNNEIKSFYFDALSGWIADWTSSLSEEIAGAVSISNGEIDIERSMYSVQISDGNVIQNNSKPLLSSALVQGKKAVIIGNLLQFDGKSWVLPSDINTSDRMLLFLVKSGSMIFPVLQLDEKTLIFRDEISTIQTKDAPLSVLKYESNSDPVFVFNDRESKSIKAQFASGASASGFPFQKNDVQFPISPLFADWFGNHSNHLILIEQDSSHYNIMVYDEQFSTVEGFPLFAGAVQDQDMLALSVSDHKLVYISTDGMIFVRELPDEWSVSSKNIYHSNTDGKIVFELDDSTIPTVSTSLLNHKEVYNWPNPADTETQIRYQTSKAARIMIDIFSLNGTKVWSAEKQSLGLSPEEIQLATLKWGSGVYFVRVQAKSNGKNDVKTFKLVVEH